MILNIEHQPHTSHHLHSPHPVPYEYDVKKRTWIMVAMTQDQP
jgi:hypothetical protein